MDQGLAAVWAGIAGLAGSLIGGGFAVRGARIGGQKAVEAAEKAAQQAVVGEHQHWIRQQRYEAYQELMRVADRLTPNYEMGEQEFEGLLDSLLRVRDRIKVLGTTEMIEVVERLATMALNSFNGPDPWYAGGQNLFWEVYQEAITVAQTVLAPPAA